MRLVPTPADRPHPLVHAHLMLTRAPSGLLMHASRLYERVVQPARHATMRYPQEAVGR